jgi:conjugative transfer signal peptidase TraF
MPAEARILSRIARHIAIGAVGFLILGSICFAAGVRVNTTKSIPVGLYRIVDESVEKGAYVIFCPPKLDIFDEAKERGYITAGFCSGDYGLMMKRVLAAENDRIVLSEAGVSINGELVPSSSPLAIDKQGRAMPRYQFSDYTLTKAELLLMSDVSNTSFDGRYFGPVDRSQVRRVIRPMITF